MQFRPDTFALTALLAFMTALGPLSTDMYLPSLPAIGTAFSVPASQVQLTLSLFLLGFSAGQVIYGPLSDRRGRKPVLLGGFLLFLVASAGCALAQSIEALIIARFLQALGASGPIVLARAIVRDLYEGPRAGQELSRMGAVMGLVPAVAPVIGGVLERGLGWRASFVLTVLLGFGLAATVWLRLPETIRHRSREAFSLFTILIGFRALLRHRGFRVYVTLSALTYGGLFIFISGSSFVLQGVYGLGEVAFGLSFGSVVIGYISGSFTAQRVVTRFGLDRTIGLGVTLLAVGGLTMLGLVLYGTGSPLEIIVPMAFYTAGVGFTMPQAMAAAMAPFADRAGAASSLLGLIQMATAALFGAVIGHLVGASALPLPAMIAAFGVAAFVLFHASGSARRPVA